MMKMNIRNKMLVGFLSIGIIPILLIAVVAMTVTKDALSDRAFSQLENIRQVKNQQVLSFMNERETDLDMLLETVAGLKQAAFDKLRTVQENKKAQLLEYFQKIAKDIHVISKSTIIIKALADFETARDVNGEFDTSLYNFFLTERYGNSLYKLNEFYGYHDLLLITLKGEIVYSSKNDSQLGRNVMNGPLHTTGLARCFQKAVSRFNYQDFEAYQPAGGRHIAFMGNPITKKDGKPLGVVVLQLTNEKINKITLRKEGMGATGETYLAVQKDQKVFLRSNRTVLDGSIGDRLADTVIRETQPGGTNPLIEIGETGSPKICVYEPVNIFGTSYQLSTHMALREVIDPSDDPENQNFFLKYIEAYGYQNLYLISQDGHILFSALEGPLEEKQQDLEDSDSGLGKVYRKILGSRSGEFVDFSLSIKESVPYAFLGAPLMREDDTIEIIVVLKLPVDGFNTIMQTKQGLGKTLDVYLVGPDKLMRSDSYLSPEKYSVVKSFLSPEHTRIDTLPSNNAIKGISNKEIAVDYRGETVLSAYGPLDVMGHTWAVIAEIDKQEAFKSVRLLLGLIFLSGLITTIGIFYLSLYVSKRIVSPIQTLKSAAENIQTRNFDIVLDTKTDDEFKVLAQAFNSMTATISEYAWNLEKKVTQLQTAEQDIRDSEERFRSLVETTSDLIWEIDHKATYTYVSPKVKDILGYEPEEILGKSPFDLMPEKDRKKFAGAFDSIAESGRPFSNLENVNLHKDGHFVILETSGVPFFNKNKELVGFRGVNRDITRRKKDEEALLLTESVFTNTIEGIAITDREGSIQRVNQAFCDITGYDPEEVAGKNPRILKSNRHDRQFYKDMWKQLLEEGQWSGEIWNRKKDGSAYPEWLSISSITDRAGKITNFVSLFHDISEKKNKEEQLQFLAFHDPLTLLPNRTLLYDRIKVSLRNARRNKTKLALLYMDIDNFKNINDSYGHPFGDEFLCRVKDRIKSICRESDTFARYGGDEFVIVLNNVLDNQQVVDFSNRIIRLFKTPLVIFDEEVYSSVSIGLAVYPDDGEDIVTLEKNADMALYEAKKDGKRRSFLFKQTLKDKMLRKTRLENAMRRSIADFGSFDVVYQPKIDTHSRQIRSAEALLRWEIDGEAVSPVEFIPIAEETNLIVPIGKWLMRKAMIDFGAVHGAGFRDVSLSINLSSKQFNDKELFDTINRLLTTTGYDPSKLCFEITESVPMKTPDKAIHIMEELNSMGIKLSMDDFGTGYSSLSVLKQFPLHELKIDRSFVKDLPGNLNDAAISKTIIQIAESLNFEVVAEGVETPEQLDFLMENGCHVIQGYLFYKPLSYEQFISALHENASEPS